MNTSRRSAARRPEMKLREGSTQSAIITVGKIIIVYLFNLSWNRNIVFNVRSTLVDSIQVRFKTFFHT